MSLTLWYMIFEGIMWPSMNVFAHILFVFVAARYGTALPLVLWFAQLTILDLAAALESVRRLHYDGAQGCSSASCRCRS